MHINDGLNVSVTVVRESGERVADILVRDRLSFDIETEAQVFTERLKRWIDSRPTSEGELMLFPPRELDPWPRLEGIIDRMDGPEKLFLNGDGPFDEEKQTEGT